MKIKEITKILKSGNFTICYHDNGSGAIYKGNHDYEHCVDEDVILEFEGNTVGYIPDEVALLIKVFGGRVESI